MTGWQVLIGSLPMLFIAPLVEGLALPHASAGAWAAFAYTTFISLVFGYFAWFKIIRIMPVHVASLSTLMVPGIGIASGALMLGEPIGLGEVAGSALIAGALSLVLFAPRPAAEPD